MKSIKIVWLRDSQSCESCGYSYATGAEVYIDGVLVLDLTPPTEHCYSSQSYDEDFIYSEIFKHLGYMLYDEESLDFSIN